MEQFKRAQVVMLPTKDITKLRTYCGSQLHISHSTFKEPYYQDQHLYIISDDEIKDGDWFICLNTNHISNVFLGTENRDNCKKIIATTDTSLISLFIPTGFKSGVGALSHSELIVLPQPSQQFIEKYIEEYNKGNIITDILVEYENDKEYWGARNQFNPNFVDFKVYSLKEKEKYFGVMFDYYPIKLKINPKDNTITIKKVKDSYSREEVIELCRKAFLLYKSDNFGYPSLIKSTQKIENKWIEENL